jgi:carboxypeptidase C (cathepsin A)
LRVSPSRFRKELLGSSDRTIGRYDARFSEFDLDPASSSARGDPAADAAFSAITAAINRYVRDELNYKTEEQYVLLSGNVNGQWDWKSGTEWGAAAANVSGDLRDVMTANPNLRVFVVCGLYDLATPFFGAEYTMDHLGINPALQSHVTFGFYPSGHMVYVNSAASAQLKRDLGSFFR